MKPFKVGKIFKIVKDDDNDYDEEAIRAELPMIDSIGYVAMSMQAQSVQAGSMTKLTIMPISEIDNMDIL